MFTIESYVMVKCENAFRAARAKLKGAISCAEGVLTIYYVRFSCAYASLRKYYNTYIKILRLL